MPYRNVYRSKIHEDMVQLLARTTVDKAETSLFTTIRQLMIFAALLGYSQNRKIPLDKTKGVEDIQIHIFENDLDYINMIALADQQNPEIFKDNNNFDVIEVFEEYANGGFEIINGWLAQYNDHSGQKAIIQGLYNNKYINKDTTSIDELLDAIIA